MNKEIVKTLIATKQSEIPFNVIEREWSLPINSRQIITVSGVRRCGKSTLLHLTINRLVASGVPRNRILWVGFDDERLFDMQAADLNVVIEAYLEMFPDIPLSEVYMFFDEIQVIKNWELFVLRVYKNQCKNIYVSGSNAQMLSEELASALRGYPIEFRAYPLSFKEYCRFIGVDTESFLEQDKAKVRNAFFEYLHESSFPEITLMTDRSLKTAKIQSYFNTMLYRDLVEHYMVKDSEILRFFLKRIMSNLTKPTSINAIFNDIKSRGFKIGKDVLYKWADYACSVFMFCRIPKYEHSIIKEQTSAFKYYIIDNGLYKNVLIPQSDDNGKLLENTVCMHLLRTLQPTDKLLYFKESAECDFVVQRHTQIQQLIQVTWQMADAVTRKRELEGLVAASKATGCDNLLVLTTDEEGETVYKDKKITILPTWKFLLQ